MTKPPPTLEEALAVVRTHQATRFAGLMQNVFPLQAPIAAAAQAAMETHGGNTVTLKCNVQSAVTLAALLSALNAEEAPFVETVRQNFIASVCSAVNDLAPVLASVAAGQLLLEYQTLACSNTQPAESPSPSQDHPPKTNGKKK